MLRLDGDPFGIEALVAVARGGDPVEVADTVAARMAPARALVERLDAAGEVVYGVTTGFGALADRAIAPDDRLALQRAVVRSHAAGMGEPMPAEVVRGMMLLRARTLAAGLSGVRPEVVDAIVAALNAHLVPWVPEHGSLGASGDLAPLAHCASTLTGEGWVMTGGERVPAGPALAEASLTPLEIAAKEGLALINGTDAMTAILGLAIHDLEQLLRLADCCAAMSVEALLGTLRAFDEEVVGLRDAEGQRDSAANLRALLAQSPIVASHRESHHAVQDAYSLRCTPQVHGAARDVTSFARGTVEREMRSVVDNPVVLTHRGELMSGGNFHGQALAYAADLLASVCADVAAISERRVDRLLDPARSRGLPAFLVRRPGINSGLMIAQYTAAACVASLRAAATPLAVQSAVSSAGQEDHVSMGLEAALRTRRSVADLRRVLAVEAVCAAQALELRAPLRPAPATGAIVASLRGAVARLDEDRHLGDDLAAADGWAAGDAWREAAEGSAGALR